MPMSIARELTAAAALLTRLPLARLAAAPPDAGAVWRRAVWAYPVIGAAIGGCGGLVWWAATRLALAPAVAAACSLAALLLLTGALHEDGLADVFDALGGATRERRLAIMRDSRIGTFGAAALMLTLAVRGAALVALGAPARVWPALIASGSLSRGAILVLLAVLHPARPDGLAASLGRPPSGALAAGAALAILIALIVLPMPTAMRAIAATALTALLLAAIATRRFGGYTGDVLGAGAVLAECVVLSLLA